MVPGSSLKDKFLERAHDFEDILWKILSYRMLRKILSWKGLKDYVLNYVNECPTCHQHTMEHTHPYGLLHPIPIPEQKWEISFMDFITGLPKVFGKHFIFVVVDRLTKIDHLFFVTTTFTAAQVAELFFK